MYLEEMKKRESHSQDMEVFLHTAFPPELGARPGIFLGCKVTKTVWYLLTAYGLNPLQSAGESLSQCVMYPQHGSCIWIAQMMQVGHCWRIVSGVTHKTQASSNTTLVLLHSLQTVTCLAKKQGYGYREKAL